MRPDFPQVVDATMINEMRSCMRKMELAYMEHWKPEGESVHLHAGAAFARGLEVTRRSFYEKSFDAETSVAHGMLALLKAYGDFEPPEGTAKTPDRMAGALEAYFAEWPLDDARGAHPTLMPSGKHAIEFSFAQPLPYKHPVTGDPIIYAGRSDMICNFAEGIYVEDDKTATQLGDSWTRQWELRSQFTGYCWAARESGISVNGVLVRGLSILKTKYGTAQAITYRSAWEIDRWLGQVLRDLARLQRAWEEGYYDFNLGEACASYGGCQFTNVCKSDDPDTWLPMYFERKRWDPLERTETLLDAPT
jgi:hypothetical protein